MNKSMTFFLIMAAFVLFAGLLIRFQLGRQRKPQKMEETKTSSRT